MKNTKYILLLILFIILTQILEAQCSMCKASVENSNTDIAVGLNNGIVYLMFIPYILIVFFGYIIFRKKFKQENL